MQVDVVLLPAHLQPGQLKGRTVVVFDVIRATTTMAAALAAGVKEIRVFGTLDAARDAAAGHDGPKLLCGEADCLRPPGFDLGNSPGDLRADRHRGHTAFMSTTNGTRAILAAGEAGDLFVGALVNASAVAAAVASRGRDVTLLCAGTHGAIAIEDLIGAGAVLTRLADRGYLPASDIANISLRLFEQARPDLLAALRDSQGGRNVVRAGLASDIDFAARLDAIQAVGEVHRVSNTPTIRTFV